MPCSTAKSTQSRSVRPADGRGTSVPGMFSPWCEATAPADLDRAAHLAGRRPEHPQAHAAVGEVDLVALGDRRRQALPRDRQLAGVADLLSGGQRQLRARVELDHAALDLVEPQLRPRQVAEQADLAAGELRGLARHRHVRGVLLAACRARS